MRVNEKGQLSLLFLGEIKFLQYTAADWVEVNIEEHGSFFKKRIHAFLTLLIAERQSAAVSRLHELCVLSNNVLSICVSSSKLSDFV